MIRNQFGRAVLVVQCLYQCIWLFLPAHIVIWSLTDSVCVRCCFTFSHEWSGTNFFWFWISLACRLVVSMLGINLDLVWLWLLCTRGYIAQPGHFTLWKLADSIGNWAFHATWTDILYCSRICKFVMLNSTLLVVST